MRSAVRSAAPETGELVRDFAASGFVNIVEGLLRHHARSHQGDRENVPGCRRAKIPTADGRPSVQDALTRSLPGWKC
jgi:hypothetical protein